MTDVEAVLEANAAFYRAFASLDVAQMEGVWLSAPYITCVHPGWRLLSGWGPVMESWERIFGSTLAMRFTLASVRAQTRGDVAWVALTEGIDSRHRDSRVEAQVEATNVFERRDGRWLLVHHHGSPVYSPLDAPEQMH
jgi:ketosteroid isomerase-like protein